MPKKVLLYEQVADYLLELIRQGVYRPGEKLPSIRQLARQRQVSVPTIQRAYNLLEDRRLIEARAKSGFYVQVPVAQELQVLAPAITGAVAPKSVSVHDLAISVFHRCDAVGVADLGTAYPSTEYLPVKQLQRISLGVIRGRMAEVVEAHFSPGSEQLRHALAQRLVEAGCQLSAADLLVTNGCQEALAICLRAVAAPGDTIAIESPGFVGLLQLIESMGFKAMEIPCLPKEGISLEALQLALEQWDIRAVAVVSSFSNPLGCSLPEANRARLVEMLAARRVPLIEDDLFGDLAFDGVRAKPCKAWDQNGLVLYCSSASKSVASGLRVGWIAPGAYYNEVDYIKSFTNVSAPMLAQLVIAEFLSSGRYDRHLRQLRTRLAQQVYRFQQWIAEFFPAGTRCSHPRGGYVLWVGLPPGIDAFELHQRAIDKGIGIVPGQLCSATQKYSDYIRINCASDPRRDLRGAIRTLGMTVQQMLAEKA